VLKLNCWQSHGARTRQTARQSREHPSKYDVASSIASRSGSALAPLARQARDVCFSGALPQRQECPSSTARAGCSNAHGVRFTGPAASASALTPTPPIHLSQWPLAKALLASSRADLVIVCDFSPGGAPYPPGEVARSSRWAGTCRGRHELSKDAFLKRFLHDGVAIHTVSTWIRHFLQSYAVLGSRPVRLSQAHSVLTAGAVRARVRPCQPGGKPGRDNYDNVKARCWDDHKAKTERDRQAGPWPGPPHPSNPP